MFKLFYQPSDMEDPEKNLIAEASNRLEVGEFQFFQLSYRAWYGRDPDPKWLEPHFFTYVMHDEPPPWVRHHARQVLEADRNGELDPNAEDVHRYDPSVVVPSRLGAWLAVTATLIVVAVFLGLIIANDPGSPRCFFPPCF